MKCWEGIRLPLRYRLTTLTSMNRPAAKVRIEQPSSSNNPRRAAASWARSASPGGCEGRTPSVRRGGIPMAYLYPTARRLGGVAGGLATRGSRRNTSSRQEAGRHLPPAKGRDDHGFETTRRGGCAARSQTRITQRPLSCQGNGKCRGRSDPSGDVDQPWRRRSHRHRVLGLSPLTGCVANWAAQTAVTGSDKIDLRHGRPGRARAGRK